MKNNRFSKFLSRITAGRGFYIALILCLVVVGFGTWAILEFSDTGVRVTAMVPENTEEVFNPQTPDPGTTVPPDVTPNIPSTPSTDPTANPKTPPTTFMWPVSGDIILPYSVDALVYNPTMADWRTHSGIDIDSELGTGVSVVADGVVLSIEQGGLLGTTITVDHGGGLLSVYANLEEDVNVVEGDEVEMGEIIGTVGQTSVSEVGAGPHLHFEMTLGADRVNPLDYLPS